MGRDEQTVPGAGRTAATSGELWVQWRLWAGHSVIQHQRNETAESPRPAAPQTEPCWLSAQATWRHGERPADSWGTGRCHGNREQTCDPGAGRQKLLLVWESTSQKVRKLKSIKKTLVQDNNQVWTGVTTKSWKREQLKNYLQAQQNTSLHKLKSP